MNKNETFTTKTEIVELSSAIWQHDPGMPPLERLHRLPPPVKAKTSRAALAGDGRRGP